MAEHTGLYGDLRSVCKLGPTVDPEADWSRWKCVYPQYIDATKTRPEGRRIPTSKAVRSPTIEEMGQICQHFELPYVLEFGKAYPRNWMSPGRVKVEFRRSQDGSLINPAIPDKRTLMLKMGELIPLLKSRATGGPRGPTTTAGRSDGGGGGGGGATAASSSSSSKKKNKK